MAHHCAHFFPALLASALITTANAQGTWTQLSPVDGAGRFWATAFTVNGIAYTGTGVLESFGFPVDDLHAYDASTDTWSTIAPFPGGAREGLVSIGHGDFGYAGMGSPGFGNTNDWYKYDPGSDTWTLLTPCPGNQWYARGFVIDDLFYLGPTPGSGAVYTFDFITEAWDTAAVFPGTATIHQVTFTLDGYGYLGMGLGLHDDWWRYDPINDSWVQVASISPGSDQSCGYALGNTGYVFNVGGNLKDLYRYNPVAGEWTFVSTFTAGRLANAEAFAINGAGYVVFGQDTENGNASSSELWRFDPVNVGVPENNSPEHLMVVSHPGGRLQAHLPAAYIGGTIRVSDATGRLIADERARGRSCEVLLPNSAPLLLLVEALTTDGRREVVRVVRVP